MRLTVWLKKKKKKNQLPKFSLKLVEVSKFQNRSILYKYIYYKKTKTNNESIKTA